MQNILIQGNIFGTTVGKMMTILCKPRYINKSSVPGKMFFPRAWRRHRTLSHQGGLDANKNPIIPQGHMWDTLCEGGAIYYTEAHGSRELWFICSDIFWHRHHIAVRLKWASIEDEITCFHSEICNNHVKLGCRIINITTLLLWIYPCAVLHMKQMIMKW